MRALTLGQAQVTLEELGREAAPEFPGLSLGARRSINLAAIAFAEVLCLRVATLKAPLVELAREAIARREAGDGYGAPQECVLLMGQIARAHKLIAERNGLAEGIRVRGERLQRVARYRAANDGSPLTDSIALAEGDVMELAPPSARRQGLPNVADDTGDPSAPLRLAGRALGAASAAARGCGGPAGGRAATTSAMT
jgi:hypothetical protein